MNAIDMLINAITTSPVMPILLPFILGFIVVAFIGITGKSTSFGFGKLFFIIIIAIVVVLFLGAGTEWVTIAQSVLSL
jgi:hypothetical protein